MLSTKKRPGLAPGTVENKICATQRTIESNTAPTLPASVERLITPDDWPLILSVSVTTVERLRRAKRLPEPDLFLFSLPRWRASTVRNWIESGGGQ
jgi:hypothetical protein